MSTVKVLEVPARGPIVLHELENEAKAFQERVGGYIEYIAGSGWGAYLNEEGNLRALPMNPRAMHIAVELGWMGSRYSYLVGTVLFIGPADENGMESDVPQFVIETARLHMPETAEPPAEALNEPAEITGRRVGKFL